MILVIDTLVIDARYANAARKWGGVTLLEDWAPAGGPGVQDLPAYLASASVFSLAAKRLLCRLAWFLWMIFLLTSVSISGTAAR